MKKLFFALVAMVMLTACRTDDSELKTEEFPQLKKTEKTNESNLKEEIRNPTDSTGVGPVVTIPPR